MDSGFRRNDAEEDQINFFTPSPVEGEGLFLTFYETISIGPFVKGFRS